MTRTPRRYAVWCVICDTTGTCPAVSAGQAWQTLSDLGWDIDGDALTHHIGAVGRCPEHSTVAPLLEVPEAEVGCVDCGENWQGTWASCHTWAEEHPCDTVVVRGLRVGWWAA